MIEPILIFFLAFLSAVIIVLVFILILIIKQIKRIAKLKARQYALFRDFTEKERIIFLGDSLTEFYRIEEFFHTYNPYNRGIAGDKTMDVLERLETNVIDLKPSKVFLQIGTNDLAGLKKASKEAVIENIKKILRRLQEALPRAELYFLSLYPINKKAKFFSIFFVLSRNNKDIKAINEQIETFCKTNNISYIDVYSHLLDEKGNLNKNYTIEGLHLNFEGYKKITGILRPYL